MSCNVIMGTVIPIWNENINFFGERAIAISLVSVIIQS